MTSAQPSLPPPAQASEPPKPAAKPATADKDAPKTEEPEKPSAAAAAEAQRLADARTAYALRRQEKELAQQKAELEAQAKQLAAEKAAREKQLAEEAALDEIALVEAIAKRTGKGVDDVVRGLIARVQNGGKATVEQQLEAVAKEAREAREYAARLEAELKRQAEEEAAAELTARQEAFLNGLRDSYAASIDENHHPILSTLDPAEVAERGLIAANAYVEQGYPMPTAQDVLEYLEAVERAEFEARAAKAGYSRGAPPPAADDAGGAAPPPGGTGVDASDWSPPARGGLQIGSAADAGPVSLAQGIQRDAYGRYVAPRQVVSNADAAARGTAPINWRELDERDRVALAGREVFGKR